MSDQLESVKNTIKEHPAETVAAVAVVVALGAIFHYKSKEKKVAERHAAELRKLHRPPWWSYLVPRRKRPVYTLDFAA